MIRAQEELGEEERLLEHVSREEPRYTHDGVLNVTSTLSKEDARETSPDSPKLVDETSGAEPQEEVMINAFKPGLIHEDCFFNFWKNELKANDWVLNTLTKGYMIPFSK